MIEKVVFYEGKLYKRQDTVRMEVINEKKITYFTGQIHCAGHAGSGDDTSQESVLSFLTQRHEFNGTFDLVKERICVLSADSGLLLDNGRAFMRRLGEIIHYIADYFTFPHNQIYDGNLKDHCMYEKELKFRLREYVKSGKAFRDRIDAKKFETPEAVCSFVKKAHEDYLKMKHGVQEDCEYIVRICHQVVQAILNLVNLAAAREAEKRFCPA